MDAREIRKWAWARADAARRELEELRAPSPETSVRAALELLDVVAELHGWPPKKSAADELEDERGWAAWARLRNRLRPA
jgi:hypothetical protein